MFKKKWLVLLMVSLSSSAFADFNPYNIFNASNNTQQNASGASGDSGASQSQNTVVPASASAPQKTASQVPATTASPYVQPSSLVAPATAKNTQLVAPATQKPVAPTNPSTSKASANTMAAPTRASEPSPANHFTPGPGFTPSNNAPSGIALGSNANPSNNSAQPPIIGGDSILKVLNTINSNMVTWKTQNDQNKIGAGAQLIPTTTQNLQSFLLNQSGLSSFLNVPLVMNNALQKQKNRVYGFLAANHGDSSNGPQTLFLLTPLTQNDIPSVLSKPGQSTGVAISSAGSINNYLAGLAQSTGVHELMSYAIGQMVNQTKIVVPGSDSMMASMQSAVNAPFMTQSQSNGSVTWLQQLQTASGLQLLRALAISSVEANQMRYIQLQNQQIMVVLQTAHVAEADAENQKLTQIISALGQTNDLLLKLYQQNLVQSSKK